MHTSSKQLLIGAHTSTSGGVHHALLEGQKIGATTIQFFTSNQKQWKGRVLSDEDIRLWQEAKETTEITTTMSHDSYLINLGSPDPLLLEKSREAFENEIKRCHALDVTYLNFHPGAYTKGNLELCLATIVESLKSIKPTAEKGSTKLLLETTAGQGTSVGHRFEQLAYIINELKHELEVGVCIDTCHIFAAGYDIRTAEGLDLVLKEFDDIVGLKHLQAFHINDSKGALGSHLDRHDNLGQGALGAACFQSLMEHPKLLHLPKYLETPNGETMWSQEIALLRQYAL